jgi:hypothetical protein
MAYDREVWNYHPNKVRICFFMVSDCRLTLSFLALREGDGRFSSCHWLFPFPFCLASFLLLSRLLSVFSFCLASCQFSPFALPPVIRSTLASCHQHMNTPRGTMMSHCRVRGRDLHTMPLRCRRCQVHRLGLYRSPYRG